MNENDVMTMIVVVICIIVIGTLVGIFLNKDEEHTEKPVDAKKDGPFKKILIYAVFIIVVTLFFGVGLFLENARYSDDCVYQDRGCQGDNRFGWP